MAMDIRIVDTHTSEVLAATRVEGVAKDMNLGGALAGFGGSGGMGGGHWAVMPRRPWKKPSGPACTMRPNLSPKIHLRNI
jgi:hypothetical protein